MKTNPKLCLAMVLSAGATALFTACASTYEVKVDSLSRLNSPKTDGAFYTIENRNRAVETDSLRYKEAAQHLKTALSGRGLWEAPNPAAADYVVTLDYAVDPARVVYKEVEVPVYVPSASPTGQANARQIFGTTTVSLPTSVSEKHLSVSCRENKPAAEGRPPLELWEVSASIEGPEDNLRECLPVLASEVMAQIGQKTDGMVVRHVRKDDRAVGFINQGM